jgi:hypothetical protein
VVASCEHGGEISGSIKDGRIYLQAGRLLASQHGLTLFIKLLVYTARPKALCDRINKLLIPSRAQESMEIFADCRLLGCGAVYIFCELTFRTAYRLHLQGRKIR